MSYKKIISSLLVLSTAHFYGDEEIASIEQNFTLERIPSSLDSVEGVDISLPALSTQKKSTFLSVGLSGLFPGLGHAYLGDYTTASALMGSSGVGYGLAQFTFFEPYLEGDMLALSTVWSYGVYSAYRDVRAYNGGSSYLYKMPQDSFVDLAWAPFQVSVLKKPEVWGGILGALTLGSIISTLAFPQSEELHIHMSPNTYPPVYAFPVSIGEESLFRGFLQSTIAESYGPWTGIILSSIAFGAAHIPNAQLLEKEDQMRYYTYILPYLSSMGAYLGWLTYKNQSLKESVAIHAWYDFAIFLGSSIASSAAIGKPNFSLSVSF